MTYMLTTSEEKIATEWKKYKGFTIRPLASTLRYYEKKIKSRSPECQYLLYGGTPEIRDIFQKNHLKLSLADQSAVMMRAMGRLTEKCAPFASNECLIEANWLSMPSINQFDLLIADDAINMVQWNQFDLFLQNAYELLRDNGYFICHLLLKPDDELIDKTFETIKLEYQAGAIKSIYDLASRLNFICFNRENYSMGWQQTIQTIGGERLQYFLPEFDFIQYFGLCNSHFYCPPQNDFEKIVKKYFAIDEIFYPHEHEYCLFEPVYLLKKLK